MENKKDKNNKSLREEYDEMTLEQKNKFNRILSTLAGYPPNG